LSPRRIKEKSAVKTGIQFEKTFALVIPIFLTDQAKRMKAPQDANIESSIIGLNMLNVKGVDIKCLKSKIRKSGRKRTAPIKF
jgi:hypothetical protein